MRYIFRLFLTAAFFVFLSFLLHHDIWAQTDTEKKSGLEQEISRLEGEAAILDKNIQDTQAQATTLNSEIGVLNNEVKSRQLDIRRLALIIKKTEEDIKKASATIIVLTEKIEKQRKALGASLFLLSTYEEDNMLTILFKNKKLSDFFITLYNIDLVQNNIQGALSDLRADRAELEKRKNELTDFQEEQGQLKVLKEVEERFLAQKKKEKDEILHLTKGKEALFQQLLASKKRNIAALRTQLFYLEKTGVTAEDAVRFADLAAKRAGIRTAFLLALLEVETGKQFEDGLITAGSHLGNGNWQQDLYQCYIRLGKRSAAEAEKNAFLQITDKLKLDPDAMPVSKKPAYGCGGAMGPAQFLPTTWLRFETRVADLTGHNPPNPWKIEDAFMAAALFLADAGAASQTSEGEIAAAKTYISGNANCRKYICKSYSSRILSLARDIDRIL